MDSASDNSVCMCGSQRCDTSPTPNPNPTPAPGGNGDIGQFDTSKDILLLQFDNMPDADDIHTQAAIGTMLKDSRFKGVNYWAVLGTYGKQNRNNAFLNSSTVMDACLGANNWVNAHPRDRSAWTSALEATSMRVINALNAGGDAWVVEAGQSDFTADLVRKIKEQTNADTKQRVHVVQHSDYNENNTSDGELDYVKSNTQYNRIADGNIGGNGTPKFKTDSGAYWNKATNLPAGLGACWAESRKVADENNYPGNGHYENPAIEAGGMDFSDTSELTWFTGFNSLADVGAFFDAFPKIEAGPTPTPEPPATPTPAPVATPAPVYTPLPIPIHPNLKPGRGWADSYSANGKCYCATTYDHGIGNYRVDTPAGRKTVREVCGKIGKGPGKGRNPVYNTVQCGHEPAHDDAAIRLNGRLIKDEKLCPGRVDQGPNGCVKIGPKWDLSVFE